MYLADKAVYQWATSLRQLYDEGQNLLITES